MSRNGLLHPVGYAGALGLALCSCLASAQTNAIFSGSNQLAANAVVAHLILDGTALIGGVTTSIEVSFDQSYRGRWQNNGTYGYPSATNYVAGQIGTNEFHDFFVFDLGTPPEGAHVTSARVELFNPATGFSSAQSSLNYTLWDVNSAPLSDVYTPNMTSSTLPATRRYDIYDDLASGASFGSRVFTGADNVTGGSWVTISLNAAAVSTLNAGIAAGGGMFGLGGAVSLVPEPKGYQMLFIGLGLVGWRLRRRYVSQNAVAH